MIDTNTVKIVGVRPPEIDVTLQGYAGINKEISVVPRRAKVPSLGLFYVGSVLEQELNQLGYQTEIDFQDLATSEPDKLSPYSREFSKLSEVKYGSGKIHKMLRGKSLSSLSEVVKDADICFMSSLFTAGASAVAQTIQAVKKCNPNTLVLLGGRDAQYRPEWYLKQGADVVFLGQAEGLAGKVIDALLRSVPVSFPGIATKGNLGSLGSGQNKISRNACLENEVLPNFEPRILKLYSESCDGILPQGISGPVMWYFTSVGCIRFCDFCPTAGTRYISLSSQRANRMFEHYKKAGIKTLLSAEDNFLARLKDPHRKEGEAEQEIIEIMKLMRSHGFAHEFSNGLEVGILADENGNLRERLVAELFAREGTAGTYRMYWPIETLVNRNRFKKLADKEAHYRILDAVLQTGIPEIVFNTILFTDYGPEEVESVRRELGEFCDWMTKHQRQTKWSLPIFHELPLPGSQSYKKLLPHSFDINLHPELWAVPINPVNGNHYNYDELYTIKRNLMEEFDPECLASWDEAGRYSSTDHTK